MSVAGAEEARRRAEALLAAHLTPRQRAEWTATGRISVVRRGVLWGLVLPRAAVLVPIALLVASHAWRPVGLLLLVAVAVLAPFWFPRLALATARRRTWLVSGRAPPLLRVRGRLVRFCVRFTEELPEADRVVAWKNLVELGEARLLEVANRV